MSGLSGPEIQLTKVDPHRVVSCVTLSRRDMARRTVLSVVFAHQWTGSSFDHFLAQLWFGHTD
jgi:hypothetical protein